MVLVRAGRLLDVSAVAPTVAPTVSAMLELADLPAALRNACGPDLGPLGEWLQSTCDHGPDPARRHLLAPNDLQVVKAGGMTFVESMVERVIEEQARGDAAKADAMRRQVVAVIGANVSAIKPGSPEAAALKEVLIAA